MNGPPRPPQQQQQRPPQQQFLQQAPQQLPQQRMANSQFGQQQQQFRPQVMQPQSSQRSPGFPQQPPVQNNVQPLTNGMQNMAIRPQSTISPPTSRRVYPGQMQAQPENPQQFQPPVNQNLQPSMQQYYQGPQQFTQQGVQQQFQQGPQQRPQQLQQNGVLLPNQLPRPPQFQQPGNALPGPPQFQQPDQYQQGVQMQQPLGPTPLYQQAGPPKSRIDPSQMPSVVQVQQQDQEFWDKQDYRTMSAQVPPLATTDYLCVDDGNAHPRFVRATTYNFPCTNELANQAGLPLGLVIQPMAKLPSNEPPVPVVDVGASGPVRCNRCKAYMNPFMKFTDGGRKFLCNICGFAGSEVPNEYFCALGMSNLRLDYDQRPELQYGTVDFVATPEFCLRNPIPASFVFLLDVSMVSLQSGMLPLACEALLEILDLFPEDDEGNTHCRMAIVAYDKAVHFFNLGKDQSEPQMLTVSDLEDSFTPLDEGFLVNPQESREVITSLITQLPKIFGLNRSPEACVGAAVAGALAGLQLKGGRLVVMQSSLANHGPGTLRSREDPKLFNTDKENTLFSPQDDYYIKLGEKCSSYGVGVDLFLFAQSYVDVASIGALTSVTGGQSHLYPGFHYQRDGLKFQEELRRIVTRDFGYDCLLRVRCGNGLRVSDHFGSFYMKNTTDVEMGIVDSEKALAVQFKHDGKLDERGETCFQVAMLYTSPSGQRLIRVSNLRIVTTNVLTDVFRFADMDTTLNFLSKAAINQTLNTQLKNVRDSLTDICVQILSSYRKSCASASSSGQLILPETLKLFPMFSLAVLKSRAFRSGLDLSSDIRVSTMRYIRNAGVATSSAFFYPRMFSLHDIQEHQGMFDPSVRHFVLPTIMRISSLHIQDHGVYLLENSETLLLYVGKNVVPQLCLDLFGVAGFDSIDIKVRQLPVLENPLSVKVRTLISHIQDEQRRGQYVQMQIIREGDPLELMFKNLLVEDRNNENMDYVDHLCLVHKMIQEHMKE